MARNVMRRSLTTPSAREVQRAAKAALQRLFVDEKELLQRDVAERTIAQHLARYLANEFPDWNVDCEYNRDGDAVKRLRFSIALEGEIGDRSVSPDIIVHKRGSSENLLVVELKKSSNPQSDRFDIRKLVAFREQLGYANAVFVRLETGVKEPTIIRESWMPSDDSGSARK